MRKRLLSQIIFATVAASLLSAQEAPVPPSAQKEHKWLEKFVGEWETVSEGTMGEGQPPIKCEGTISSRMVGPFWVVSETNAELFGTPMLAYQSIGYDPKSKKYIGTWIDSMLPHMWRYEGTVDASGNKLTLEAEGPNFTQPGKTSKFRDCYEFKSPDHIYVTSSMLGDDGEWITFMTGNATRKK